ncbi:MAG: hypothetical protein H6667_07180 [Ardenticatenaceae bacterium]|nr:hypothetical protein [Ardenticatenaceae bacterium]MCB9444143.1 hypothetical protein [Ardenticatenaceae bacterium]
MFDPIESLKRLKQRQADAAEMLWGDGRLRDSLPDKQATQLLDWAVRYVKSELNFTVDWPEDETDGFADALVTAVRRLLIQINQIVPTLASLDETEAETQVAQFRSSLHELTGQDVLMLPFDLLAPDRQSWDTTQTFQQIMDILTAEPEEE